MLLKAREIDGDLQNDLLKYCKHANIKSGPIFIGSEEEII